MSWPLSQDYNEAIQDPPNSFRDPELRAGEAVVNALGLPMPRSGNFADVYQFRCPQTGNTWALKCFTRHVSGLQMRYAEISQHLVQASLPFTVDFTYLHQGIRVGGEWYPLVKMRWVEGFTLNEFVRNHLDKPPTLDLLCQLWQKLARRLREANVAHADLQHGNVLLVPGKKDGALAVKLIDYDGMWVPTLASTPSGEVGHPAYQHPQRLREGTYSPEVDRFPHLVIYTALQALRVGGRALWEKYDNGDNLLFRDADLRSPRESALFRELIRLDSDEVRMLADRLSRAAAGALEKVPLLDELLPEKPAPGPQSAAAPPASTPRTKPAPAPAVAARPVLQPPKVRRRPAGSLRTWIAGLAAVAVLGVCGVVAGVLVLANRRTPISSPEGVVAALKQDSDTARQGPSTEIQPAFSSVPSARTSDTPTARSATPITAADTNRTPTTELTTRPPSEPKPPNEPKSPTEPKTEPKTTTEPKWALGIEPGPPGEARRYDCPAEIRRLALTRDGRQAFLGCWDSFVYLWDLEKGGQLFRGIGHSQPRVCGVACFAERRLGLSGCWDKTVRLWDLDDGQEVWKFEGHTEGIESVAVSRDGRFALSCGSEPTVFLWDVATGKVLHRLPLNQGGAWSVAFSPNGQVAYAATHQGTVRRWEVETGKELGRFEGHTGDVWAVAVSPDGRFALSSGADQTVRLWQVDSGRELRRLEGHRGIVSCVAFSLDGRRALSGGDDRTARLWDLEKGKEVYRFEGHTAGVSNVAFLPDGSTFLSGSMDRTMRLWRLPPAGPDEGKPLEIEAPVQKADKRVPRPDDAALASALKEIKEVYKADYTRKKTQEDIKAFAGKLFQAGVDTRDKPAIQFVLLQEARDQAARASDVDLALRAAAKLGEVFAVDIAEMSAQALEQASRAAASPTVALNSAADALALLDDAAEADDYTAADRLAKAAQTALGVITNKAQGSRSLEALAQYRANEMQACRKAYEPLADAVKALAKSPDDADANLALGKFYCLDKGDWDRGLPLLARAGDPQWKDLARKDLALPPDPAGQAGLADGYAALAKEESPPRKLRILRRAWAWYEQAAASLPAASRADVVKKIGDIQKTVPIAPATILFAAYGNNETWMDVTLNARPLLAQAKDFKLSAKTDSGVFGVGDPVPFVQKTMVIVYRFRERVRWSITADGDMINLPIPDPGPVRSVPHQSLTILYAGYGAANLWKEATARAQSLVKESKLTVKPEDLDVGDPAFGKHKALVIVYLYAGKLFVSITGEGETAMIPAKASSFTSVSRGFSP
jgi:hypothetical protein